MEKNWRGSSSVEIIFDGCNWFVWNKLEMLVDVSSGKKITILEKLIQIKFKCHMK